MTAKPSARRRVLLCAAILMGRVMAQSPEHLDVTAIGKDPKWKVVNRVASVATVKGKRAVKLSEGAGMGVAWLEGYDFGNGTIDVDILGRSHPIQGSFVGVAFHVANSETYDAVYFRPFNFRTTDAVRRSHAVQYVSHPKFPWQLLRAEHPNEYERAVEPIVDGDNWFHARVVLGRPKVSVFVNGSAVASLVVSELSGRTGGSLGLWVGEGSGGYFANLRVEKSQ